MMRARIFLFALVLVMSTASAGAQRNQRPDPPLFVGDAYTSYEMLAPGSNQFRIIFLPFETEPGTTLHLNGTRHGSEGSDIQVYDPRTGKPLKFEYLSGAEMKAEKMPGRFTDEDHYIRAHLPWPVPEGGEGRVRTEKTYKDKETYYSDGEDLIFKRSLGNGRQAVILPKGYEVVSSNVAGQIIAQPNGQIRISFADINAYGADVMVRARKTTTATAPNNISDRAWEDSKTLYDLMEPSAHSFTVRQDYTDYAKGSRQRLGLLSYITLENLKVIDLDTAKPLKTSKDGNATFVTLEVPITQERQSAHLRAMGKATDANYKIENGEFIFERTVWGVRNTVLLPAGWTVTGVSQPATINSLSNGRNFVQFTNGRMEESMKIQVRGRKRSSGSSQ